MADHNLCVLRLRRIKFPSLRLVHPADQKIRAEDRGEGAGVERVRESPQDGLSAAKPMLAAERK
jgi:hypothetical protein